MTRAPQSSWNVTVLTLFPEMFPGPLSHALAGKALDNGLWHLTLLNIRDFATGNYKSVDDVAFGGGPGMVLRPEVMDRAFLEVKKNNAGPLIYLTPRGKPLKQADVKRWSHEPHINLICGRYEGIDERVLRHHQVEEISIGDYILAGGEIAAMVVMDACVRLLPGVMGAEASLQEESFEGGLLEYPQYTRPQTWKEYTVPEVLLSGHHARIRTWRKAQAEAITRERRPDLWEAYKRDKKG